MKMVMARGLSTVAVVLAVTLSAMPLLPKTIKTVCISTFSNDASSGKLADRMREEIASEFLARTHYRLVSDPARADAVLVASIVYYTSHPAILDPVGEQPRVVETDIMLRVIVTERTTRKILFDRPSFEVQDRYQIGLAPSQDAKANDVVFHRTAMLAARHIIGEILEYSGAIGD